MAKGQIKTKKARIEKTKQKRVTKREERVRSQ